METEISRRAMIAIGGAGMFSGVVVGQEKTNEGTSIDSSEEFLAAVTWPGDDKRFWHRKGGRRHESHSWLDKFSEPNQNLAVCSTNRKLTLERGSYRVSWDAEVVFRSPACRSPSRDYPVLLSSVHGNKNVNGGYAQKWYSQVYVCAKRNGLLYRGSLSTDFKVTEKGAVDISISAFNDERTYEPTDINAREVIIYKMVVSRTKKELDDNDLRIVYPMSLGE